MESSLAAIIIVTLILFGALTLSHSYLTAQAAIAESWSEREARAREQAQTALSPGRAQTLDAGSLVEIAVLNDGGVKLADFARWDVILDYHAAGSRQVQWYPYIRAIAPGSDQWTVTGIYLDEACTIPEVYDPGILNPGEVAVIRVRVAVPVGSGTINQATVSTWNGISATTVGDDAASPSSRLI